MVYSPALDQIFNILPNLNDFLLWLEAKLIVSVQRGMSQEGTDIDSKGSDWGNRDGEEVPRRAARIASVINSKTFRF